MLRTCANEACGRVFETRNLRRVFCCEKCRRAGQNAVRRLARAEAREARERALPMADPWALRPADEWEADAVWANALLDALPAGLAETAGRKGTERPAGRPSASGSGAVMFPARAAAGTSASSEPCRVPASAAGAGMAAGAAPGSASGTGATAGTGSAPACGAACGAARVHGKTARKAQLFPSA